jgi:hypothetical protein
VDPALDQISLRLFDHSAYAQCSAKHVIRVVDQRIQSELVELESAEATFANHLCARLRD